MKRPGSITIALLSILSICLFSCKSSDNEDLLSNSYAGLLTVEYTKGFPAFTTTVQIDVDIKKDGTVTFSGGGDTEDFDAEDILYDEGEPATKIKMTGMHTLNEAQGEIKIINDSEYVLVLASSAIYGQMTVWAWGGNLGWVQVLDELYTYEEDYGDGTLQFSLINASSQNGENIKKTMPDIQGTFTYGYNLTLNAGL